MLVSQDTTFEPNIDLMLSLPDSDVMSESMKYVEEKMNGLAYAAMINLIGKLNSLDGIEHSITKKLSYRYNNVYSI